MSTSTSLKAEHIDFLSWWFDHVSSESMKASDGRKRAKTAPQLNADVRVPLDDQPSNQERSEDERLNELCAKVMRETSDDQLASRELVDECKRVGLSAVAPKGGGDADDDDETVMSLLIVPLIRAGGISRCALVEEIVMEWPSRSLHRLAHSLFAVSPPLEFGDDRCRFWQSAIITKRAELDAAFVSAFVFCLDSSPALSLKVAALIAALVKAVPAPTLVAREANSLLRILARLEAAHQGKSQIALLPARKALEKLLSS